MQIVLGILVGAGLGYGYHRVIGCRSGTCAITANPWASTVYGALMGWLIASP